MHTGASNEEESRGPMEIGDRVRWTHVVQGGREISMRLREGVIEDILPGGVALVKKRRGREHVALRRLRRPEEESQLSEFVDVVRAVATGRSIHLEPRGSHETDPFVEQD